MFHIKHAAAALCYCVSVKETVQVMRGKHVWIDVKNFLFVVMLLYGGQSQVICFYLLHFVFVALDVCVFLWWLFILVCELKGKN